MAVPVAVPGRVLRSHPDGEIIVVVPPQLYNSAVRFLASVLWTPLFLDNERDEIEAEFRKLCAKLDA